MAGKHELSVQHITRVLDGRSAEEAANQLSPDLTNLPARIPTTAKVTPERVQKLWDKLDACPSIKEALYRPEDLEAYSGNIENLLGTLRMPVGVAGP